MGNTFLLSLLWACASLKRCRMKCKSGTIIVTENVHAVETVFGLMPLMHT